MAESLAIKYRPKTWEDVTEQRTVVEILKNQIETNELQHAYLFCGGAGTGKTTCARIFANDINKGHGNPVELDAASHNSVDDVRIISQQAKTQSLDSEYRVYILDEVHALSNNAWQAMLKLLEEPPAKSIFIMCTTERNKIPKTILSRVQQFNFTRISQDGITKRLRHIIDEEKEINESIDWYGEALEYIAKIADGGMRDAITMLDKCLAYSDNLTLENVVNAIGATDYETMFRLSTALFEQNSQKMFEVIDGIHSSGKDLKLFINNYLAFVLDICKYNLCQSFNNIQIPSIYENELAGYKRYKQSADDLLHTVMRLSSDIKWDSKPKIMIESVFYQYCLGGEY